MSVQAPFTRALTRCGYYVLAGTLAGACDPRAHYARPEAGAGHVMLIQNPDARGGSEGHVWVKSVQRDEARGERWPSDA
jgi:hypothetical protein